MPMLAWKRILTLAQRYGWKPEGTAPPDDLARESELWNGDPRDWDGRYLPSCGQHVTDGDAQGLAAALERALSDIPDHSVFNDPKNCDPDEPWLNADRTEVSPLEAFSGPNKQLLKDFIAHCREDGGLWMY